MQRIHNEPLQTGGVEMSAPPLVALVYRIGDESCQQYAFASSDELALWVARKPYCDERLFVIVVGPDKRAICDTREVRTDTRFLIANGTIAARDVVEFVRSRIVENRGR